MGPVSRRLLRGTILQVVRLVVGTVGALRQVRGQGAWMPAVAPRILVVRLDLLGDVVFTMHAVSALRSTWPDARIVMLTLPYTADVAALYGLADEIVAIDTNAIRRPRGLFSPGTWRSYGAVLRSLRREHFDLALSISGKTASLCAWLSGARRTVGYRDEAYPNVLTDAVPGGRYLKRIHETDYCLALARVAGASIGAPPRPCVAVDERARARERLREVTGPVVVLHPGAGHGTAKRWPVRHWVALARQLAQGGSGILLVGGPGDSDIAGAIAGSLPAACLNLAGATSVTELAAVLAEAALVISADSGPLHLAAALGAPVVGLYGPTDPLIYGPGHGANISRVERADIACSPCYSAKSAPECPLGYPICMDLVTPDSVLKLALRLLR